MLEMCSSNWASLHADISRLHAPINLVVGKRPNQRPLARGELERPIPEGGFK
jgi:hypothetical protein